LSGSAADALGSALERNRSLESVQIFRETPLIEQDLSRVARAIAAHPRVDTFQAIGLRWSDVRGLAGASRLRTLSVWPFPSATGEEAATILAQILESCTSLEQLHVFFGAGEAFDTWQESVSARLSLHGSVQERISHACRTAPKLSSIRLSFGGDVREKNLICGFCAGLSARSEPLAKFDIRGIGGDVAWSHALTVVASNRPMQTRLHATRLSDVAANAFRECVTAGHPIESAHAWGSFSAVGEASWRDAMKHVGALWVRGRGGRMVVG